MGSGTCLGIAGLMKAGRYKKMGIAALLALALGILFSWTPYWKALTKGKKQFLEIQEEERVLYEPGAETHARAIADFLPEAVSRVEEKQLVPFSRTFHIYVCNTQKSLSEYLGTRSVYPIRGAVLGGNILISPSAFSFQGQDTYRESILHELSHLHLRQQLGQIREKGIPIWFREGLADYVAGSGGEGVSEAEASDMILSGRHFIPVVRSSVFSSFPKALNDLSGPMFHRQVKMFVTYLAETRPMQFGTLLKGIVDGSSFEDSLEGAAFDLQVLWSEFIQGLDLP
jgi:hypothetical protein